MFRQHLSWYTICIAHIQNNMVRSRLFCTLLVQHHCVTSSVLMDEVHVPVMERQAFIYTRSDVKSIFHKVYPQHCRPGTNQDAEPGLKTIYRTRRIWVIHCDCVNYTVVHWRLQSWRWRSSCPNYHRHLKTLHALHGQHIVAVHLNTFGTQRQPNLQISFTTVMHQIKSQHGYRRKNTGCQRLQHPTRREDQTLQAEGNHWLRVSSDPHWPSSGWLGHHVYRVTASPIESTLV